MIVYLVSGERNDRYMSSAFWLTNARLESGYEVQDGVITGTKTEIRHIFIEDGKIAKIATSDTTITDEWPRCEGFIASAILYRKALPFG